MSFDKPTRNLLAKTVAACRERLAVDIADQLQSAYGLYPDGTQLDVARTEAERRAAQDLRALLAHYESNLPQGKDRPQMAYQRLVREAGFTLLNRLAALRLCEERGLVIECVRQGIESDGFRLYDMLAGGALGNRHQTYRAFLERLFDELARDLGALFDRSNPLSHLFPSEAALSGVLDLLNDPELARRGLWAQDETIGWMYQYYNDPAERKKMREESQAPRNSRELAVRNQFFTPRYVVEFLADNTLGRLWVEMRGGVSRLVEACRYLVSSDQSSGSSDQLSAQSERSSVISEPSPNPKSKIANRKLKDPRDLKILDPACGSGHFLLYVFDLLLMIYEEAWGDADLPLFSESGTWLARDYPSLEDLRRAAPELILRHNLHGVDIDPRAAQIAALALWLRAQRAWQELGVPAGERPQVTRTNVVVAEPMPGDARLLEEFIAGLAEVPFIGQLVRVVFEKMKLAGEAGSLLKVEVDLRKAIAAAKKQWLTRPAPEQMGLWAQAARPRQEQLRFDLSGISDEQFWLEAEGRALAALSEYARQAENGQGARRRLFAEEAGMGFAFVDLCRKQFDVVLMNPPFGQGSTKARSYLDIAFPEHNDLASKFITRSTSLLSDSGFVGAITTNTIIMTSSASKWRLTQFIENSKLRAFLDLGGGVLDNAMVETAAYTIENNRQQMSAVFIDLTQIESPDKAPYLSHALDNLDLANDNLYWVAPEEFSAIPGNPFSYWTTPKTRAIFKNTPMVEGYSAHVRKGLTTSDDFRFVRCWWEVDSIGINRGAEYENATWVNFSKGGSYSPFFADIHLVINWDRNAQELRAFPKSYLRNEVTYFKSGLSFPIKNRFRFSVKPLPAGSVYGHVGSSIFSIDENQVFKLMALFHSKAFSFLIKIISGWNYEIGSVQNTPLPVETTKYDNELSELARDAVFGKREQAQGDEISHLFTVPNSFKIHSAAPNKFSSKNIETILDRIDNLAYKVYDFGEKDIIQAENYLKSIVVKAGEDSHDNEDEPDEENISSDANDNISWLVGCAFSRWDIRYATGEKTAPDLPDPFAPLPACSPGMLQNAHGLPATPEDVPADYPLPIPWDGILVDDSGLDGKSPHPEDLVERARQVLRLLWPENHAAIEAEACEILGVRELRDYFRKPGGFFADHLKRYSKSRRQAPIYWPLSTASGAYTLWLYYPRLSAETLPTALNRFVDPKIAAVSDYVAALEVRLNQISGRATTDLRDELDRQKAFLAELRDFRAELLHISALPYQPDLNDGVILNAAPFHRLFRLGKWSKDTESAWKKLQGGEYDWSHIAYVLWPERVREVCKTDKSIAIAHGLESVYTEVAGKKVKGNRKKSAAEDEEMEL